jgi:UDP-N-acetylmuramoyl-tripeptide--D-alanyl-D-alanine ligase
MSLEEVAAALSTVATPPQRGEVLRFADGFTVINDSYNSNPDALLSMVDTLVDGGAGASRKIVVAGEMLELGDDELNIHRETGERLGTRAIDIVIGVRGLAKELVEGAKNVGAADARFAEDSEAAGRLLSELIKPGDVVLVKGSRGVKTEKVIEKLVAEHELEEEGAGQRA